MPSSSGSSALGPPGAGHRRHRNVEAGKGTIERILLERHPELELAVSATTRDRRPNEVDGKHYWFLSDEEFDRRLAEKGFLEYVTFPWGQRSGTLLSGSTAFGRRGACRSSTSRRTARSTCRRRFPGL